MVKYNEVMVDIETTGTQPDRHNIIQIAAVKFSLDPVGIDTSSFFKQSLLEVPHRTWSESTRGWWNTMPELLKDIQRQALPAADVMKEFQMWAHRGTDQPRFWAKPTSFDFPFVASYFSDCGLGNPFHFSNAVDCRSWVDGRCSAMDNRTPISPKDLPFEGVEHDALFDVLHQIKWILKVQEETGITVHNPGE